jgi:hypothetical protein
VDVGASQRHGNVCNHRQATGLADLASGNR